MPFETKSWIERNALLEKKLWTLYCNPKTKNSIFDIENVSDIRELFMGYDYVQSLQVIRVLPNLRAQIMQQNLPHDIEALQCIFVESFCASVLSVFELSELLDVNYLEANRFFFFKRNGRQGYCVRQQLFEKVTQFRFKLLQKCNLKAVKKSSREKKVCCVWFCKKNVGTHRCFGISTLTNKALQCIIT